MADKGSTPTKSKSRPPAPQRSNSDQSEDTGYESRSRSASRRRRRQSQRQRGQAQSKALAGKSKAQSMAAVQEQEEPEEEEEIDEWVQKGYKPKSQWLTNPDPQDTTETQPFDYIKPASQSMMGPVTYARMLRGEIPWVGPPPTQPLDTTKGSNAKQDGPDPMDQDGLKLRIELNLDIEIELKAHIHGDLTLALIAEKLRPVIRRPAFLTHVGYTPVIQRRNEHAFYHRLATGSEDTIYALSTAPGRAAVAVIRISGPSCLLIYSKICPKRSGPKPRTAILRKLTSPDDGRTLDAGALLLYFPSPKSVTGEDVLELHIHGGPAIVRSVLKAISQCAPSASHPATIRPAEAGEFTKRAFYNNKIDLAEVEALGEALAAETEQQRRLALSGASSGLTQRYEEWRSILLYARGELEALIDFSEDQHFDESPAEFMASVSTQVLDLKKRLELHILNAGRGELLRSGIDIALLGAPNAGKSSLLNKVVGREAAIVSAEAGTTRDIVDVNLDLQGWLVRLGDMAGLRSSSAVQNHIEKHTKAATDASSLVGEIEQEGIRRARERALQSDLVIVLVSIGLDSKGCAKLVVNDELRSAVEECITASKYLIFVVNKIDLLHGQTSLRKVSISKLLSDLMQTFPNIDPTDVFCLSCKEADSMPDSGEVDPGGLQNFVAGLVRKFGSMTSAVVAATSDDHSKAAMSVTEAQGYWVASLSVTHRQSEFLRTCLGHLEDFLEASAPAVIVPSIATHTGVLHDPRQRKRADDRGYFDTSDDHGTVPTLGIDRFHVDNHADIVGEIIDDKQIASIPYSWAASSEKSSVSSGHDEIDIVTAAEHLRAAADCLAKLTGRSDGTGSGGDVEDVLGVVFEKFCVGK